VSIITYGELYEGVYYSRNPEAALAGLEAFLEGKEILPLSQAVMEHFAIVRGALPRQIRQQIGDLDILIAATCLEHHLILLTTTVRTFSKSPTSSSTSLTNPAVFFSLTTSFFIAEPQQRSRTECR
jgi:predicted nucleic acid-binding protein